MASRPPQISLGELPFSLTAIELRRAGDRALHDAEERLDSLVRSARSLTVEGFLAPLDRILADVRDVEVHGALLFAVHPEEEVRSAGRAVSEAADRFLNAFRVNDRVYRSLGALPLPPGDAETAFAVEKMRREMRRAGVELDPSARSSLLALSNEIDRTANEFQENIARSSRSIRLASSSELEGLPADFVARHPPGQDGSVRLTTRYPDFYPVLAHAARADVRRRLLAEFLNTAYPENVPVLDRLRRQRRDFARALGYSNFAAFAIETKMLRTPEAVGELLERVTALLRGPAAEEYARFLARKQREEPGSHELHYWDAGFVSEGYYDGKIRAEEFGVDSSRLRNYLPFGRVRDGLFRLCEELLGLSFERVDPTGLWHPSVESFDVRHRGTLLGRCYLDMVPRDGKYNHAACFTVRGGVRGERLPQAALVCNFLPPDAPHETARLEYAQVTTFFHEFGHLLHALFSGQPRWLYHSMEYVEWDFVEAPSLLFEEWARDPGTLARFARDPDTGEGIPAEVLERLRSAEALGRSSRWLRQTALAAVSLTMFHRDPDETDASDLMREVYGRYALIPLGPEYHPATGFGHLTGYSAFYYTYLWSLVLARDLLRPFLDRGVLTDPALAERYVREILVPGSSRPALELVRSYLGRDPGFASFERWIRDGIELSGSAAGTAPGG